MLHFIHHKQFRSSCLCFLLTLLSLPALSEGTRELAPGNTPDDTVTNILIRYTNTPTSAGVGYFGAPADRRIYFNVQDHSREIVTLGLPWRTIFDWGQQSNEPLYYRIKDPNGNIVLLDSLAYGLQGFKTHNVREWADAYNGPNIPGVGTGYDTTGYVFNPQMNGDFYIEFAGTRDAQGYDDIPHNLILRNFDITVVDVQGAPVAKNGRLWSYRWTFQHVPLNYPPEPGFEDGFDRPFEGKVYILGDCNFVTAVDFRNSGMRGWQFELAFNGTGPGTTGDLFLDRQSIAGRAQNADYPIFANEPDPAAWPSTTEGTIISGPTLGNSSNTCDPSGLFVGMEVLGKGQIEILLDLHGGDGVYTENTADRVLVQNVDVGCNEQTLVELNWGGIDGQGNLVSDASQVSLVATFSQSPTHIMLFDVEYMPTGYKVDQIRPNTGYVPMIFYDDRQITDENTTSGSPAAKISLEGCDAPCHTWDNYINWAGYAQDNTINSWWFTFQEKRVLSALVADCGTFPVEWLGIDAVQLREGVEVTWETASELNTSHFAVERKLPGSSFEQMTVIDARNQGQEYHSYEWLDRNAYQFANELIQYRVKAIDFDGTFSYSSTVEVKANASDDELILRVGPNPFTNQLTMNARYDGRIATQLKVFDAIGKLTYYKVLQNPGEISVETSAWPSGMYYVQLVNELEQTTKRIIKY